VSVKAPLREAVRFRFADHDGVRLDLDAEQQRARMLQQLEEIAPQEHLASAEHQKEHSGCGKLIEQVLDLGRGHFAVVVVVQITVDAPLITSEGHVQLDAQRNAQFERFRAHFLHQAHRMGSSESFRMPCAASSWTKLSASFMASSRVTSNAAHTCCSTICSSGVRPSAASQIADAAPLRLNRVESRGDRIMVSPPNILEARSVLRAM